MVDCVVKGACQMFKQTCCHAKIIIIRNGFVQNGEITGFTDVSGSSGNQPQWIIVESATDITVPFFVNG